MIARSQLAEWADRIVREFKPRQIILFGSHAYGDPKEDSDVDLLVVMPHVKSSIQTASEIRLALPSERAIDVLVRTPDQIQKRLNMNDYFIRDVLARGRVLYDAGNA